MTDGVNISTAHDPPAVATPSGIVGIIMPIALQRGGCETMLLNLLRANRQGVNQTYCLCFLEDGPMVEEVKSLGYRVTVLSVGRLRQSLRFAASVIRLARWIRSERVSQVISWMEKAHLYASPAGMLARTPTAWWLHSIDPGSFLMRLVTILPANHVFSDSQAALDLQNPRWRRHDSSVCHCAVDLSRFSASTIASPAEARLKLQLPSDRPIVAVISRLQRWKGIDVFLRAAARVVRLSSGSQKLPSFVVVGGEHSLEPGVKQELESLIDELGIREHVAMVGYQSNVPFWMQAADVIVHCSTGVEPFGTVIVEAMALAKNVVAARAGGPREIITDGIDGRLTTPGDPDALAAAIQDLLPDTPANRAMREAAKQRAGHFSADRLARQLQARIQTLSQRH
jgi:glycosyltransferase involved in cell wall biosynthesis